MSEALKKETAKTDLATIRQILVEQGYVLLRNENYTLESFSSLMNQLCDQLTFDPAREYSSEETQKVDAGTAAVGLHIENGNTPLPPGIVAFHSALSASRGSQTTLCDGALVYQAMSPSLRALFSQPMTVSRHLPELLWKSYVAKALGIDEPTQVDRKELDHFIQILPGQSYRMADNGNIEYTLSFDAVRRDNLSSVSAFANAILGPSYNYELPTYRFSNGQLLSDSTLLELKDLCERYTEEIQWKNGDVAIIDNKRFLHGRREILVPLTERKLYIGMGLGLRF
jgi:hypothetical protein